MKITHKTINIVLLTGAVLYLLVNPGFRRLIKHEIERRKIESDIERLKKENEKLATEIHLMETDKNYYALVVRRELGMLKPGEVEYRIVKNQKIRKKAQ